MEEEEPQKVEVLQQMQEVLHQEEVVLHQEEVVLQEEAVAKMVKLVEEANSGEEAKQLVGEVLEVVLEVRA